MLSQINQVRELSLDEVINYAPSIVTTVGSNNLSNIYSPINTIDIIEMLSKDHWYPVKAEEVKAQKQEKKGFQKHLIRFQNDNLQFKDENIECILTNSHDGLSSYQFMLGVFRFVCSNGLIVGDTFDKIRLRHVGLDQNMVEDASKSMLAYAPQLNKNMSIMKQIELNPIEKDIFAESAKMLLFPKDELKDIPLKNSDLLVTRRYNDVTRTLWDTFNTVQENVTKGKIRYYVKNEKTGYTERKRTRLIKAIDRNVSINRALWNLADRMKKLKTVSN